MRLCIALLTANEEIKDVYGRQKGKIVPEDAFTRGYYRNIGVVPRTISYAGNVNNQAEFERFVASNLSSCDAFVALADSGLLFLAKDLRYSIFIHEFKNSECGASIKNFLQSAIAQAIRAFGHLAAKFSKSNDAQLLSLPLRNFNAEGLRNLCVVCRDQNSHQQFNNSLDSSLATLRSRVRPRRKSRFRIFYAVDDHERFFKYGVERHARFATGMGHLVSCEINGSLRFGHSIDQLRHYNVSESESDATTISGQFPDCHGVVHSVAVRTHLNMFSNDFF